MTRHGSLLGLDGRVARLLGMPELQRDPWIAEQQLVRVRPPLLSNCGRALAEIGGAMEAAEAALSSASDARP